MNATHTQFHFDAVCVSSFLSLLSSQRNMLMWVRQRVFSAHINTAHFVWIGLNEWMSKYRTICMELNIYTEWKRKKKRKERNEHIERARIWCRKVHLPFSIHWNSSCRAVTPKKKTRRTKLYTGNIADKYS